MLKAKSLKVWVSAQPFSCFSIVSLCPQWRVVSPLTGHWGQGHMSRLCFLCATFIALSLFQKQVKCVYWDRFLGANLGGCTTSLFNSRHQQPVCQGVHIPSFYWVAGKFLNRVFRSVIMSFAARQTSTQKERVKESIFTANKNSSMFSCAPLRFVVDRIP